MNRPGYPALATRLADGETVITGWSGLPDARIAAICGRAGYPAVTLDMQHGLHDMASIAVVMQQLASE